MCKEKETNAIQEMYDGLIDDITQDVLETLAQAEEDGENICFHCLLKDAIREAFNEGLFEGKMLVLDVASESIESIKSALIEEE